MIAPRGLRQADARKPAERVRSRQACALDVCGLQLWLASEQRPVQAMAPPEPDRVSEHQFGFPWKPILAVDGRLHPGTAASRHAAAPSERDVYIYIRLPLRVRAPARPL